ncbi:hypothetical protein Tco_0818406 [Tanacetum coccineum]
MAAGSRDRLSMLAIGRYAQWRSRFLRYIDTRPNGDALRKCILEGPYTPTTVVIPAVPATDNSPEVPEQTTVETVLNMSLANKAHFESEKEAIHLILTRIGDEIYSTVDACKIAHEMWIAIKRLQQEDLDSLPKYFKNIYKPTNNNLRTSSNTRNKNVDTTPRYKNDNQSGQFRNQRTMTIAGARETIDTDEEIDEQELEAHYSFYGQRSRGSLQLTQAPNLSIGTVETGDSNVIPFSPDMCDNDIQNDQNAVECDDERVALANLIENLKLDVDENKSIQKQLKKSNTTLAHEFDEC